MAFTRWVIRWRWAVLPFCLIVAIAAASGGRFLGFASDYRVFFSSGNPQLEAFETMQRVYSKDDNISFVIKPAFTGAERLANRAGNRHSIGLYGLV